MNIKKENINEIKEKLILEGIKDIEKHGIQGLSLRRVATNCGVSCAAPYKHFKDKNQFISEIIKYINQQWYIRQELILKECKDKNVRYKLTEISLEYIRFLIENSHFRSIIMLKDKDIDPQQARLKSELSFTTKELIKEYCQEVNMDEKSERIKTFIVRSMIYGAALMFDNGELEQSEENFQLIAKSIEREFDLD